MRSWWAAGCRGHYRSGAGRDEGAGAAETNGGSSGEGAPWFDDAAANDAKTRERTLSAFEAEAARRDDRTQHTSNAQEA